MAEWYRGTFRVDGCFHSGWLCCCAIEELYAVPRMFGLLCFSCVVCNGCTVRWLWIMLCAIIDANVICAVLFKRMQHVTTT